MKEKRGLGKGLSALLLPRREEERREEIMDVEVEKIKTNPYQPRSAFDEEKLRELAKTIKERGIIEPLVVRKTATGYELISGERRLKAAKMAGLKSVPCIVRAVKEEEMLELALIENLQREDLNPVEEARAYRMLKEKFGMTQEEIAEKVGKDRATVANIMRLLKLPEEVLQGLSEGKISEGHAKVLLSIQNPQEVIKTYRRIVKNGLSVRALESLFKEKPPREKDPNISRLVREIERVLQAKVNLTLSRKGRGILTIKFSSVDHLNDILEKMGIRDTL